MSEQSEREAPGEPLTLSPARAWAGVDEPENGHRAMRDTWGSKLPALRLSTNGVEGAPEGIAEPSAPTAPLNLKPPVSLRIRRFVVGITLLAGAWVGVVSILSLAMFVADGIPSAIPLLSPHLLVVIAAIIGIGWLAVVSIASIVVGAFALSLALTARGW